MHDRIIGLIEGSLVIDGADARCRVRFSPDEPVFRGHFPGNPVVPGVFMMEGLVSLAVRLGGGGKPSAIKEAKFRALARPDDELLYRVSRSGGGFAGSVERDDGESVLAAKFSLSS